MKFDWLHVMYFYGVCITAQASTQVIFGYPFCISTIFVLKMSRISTVASRYGWGFWSCYGCFGTTSTLSRHVIDYLCPPKLSTTRNSSIVLTPLRWFRDDQGCVWCNRRPSACSGKTWTPTRCQYLRSHQTPYFSRHMLTWLKRFDEWRQIWRDDDGEVDVKFELYAKSNLPSAKRILRQLALLSQALFDARALEEQYGIQPDRSNRVRATSIEDCLSRWLYTK